MKKCAITGYGANTYLQLLKVGVSRHALDNLYSLKMAKMRKMRRAAVILIVLWLLPHAPSITFFSERPYLVSLAVDRKVASRVASNVLDLLPPEDH